MTFSGVTGLRELAEKALSVEESDMATRLWPHANWEFPPFRDFIAAANPETVLALLDVVQAAKALSALSAGPLTRALDEALARLDARLCDAEAQPTGLPPYKGNELRYHRAARRARQPSGPKGQGE